jgi:hypothetical protein
MLTTIILPSVLLTALLLVLFLLAFVVQELVTTKKQNLDTQKLYQENLEEMELLIRRLEESLPVKSGSSVKTSGLKIITNKN